MRVTNLMLGQNLLANLESVQTTMTKYQDQLSSGKKINQPADDPVGTQLALGLKGALSDNTQWQSNASSGLSFLQTANSTLQNILEMVSRARTLAVQANNTGSLTSADQESMANEAEQILNEVGSLSNTQVGNQYVFSGTSTAAPWQGAANWSGNNGIVNTQVGKDEKIPLNADYTGLFSGPNSVFNVLINFTDHLKGTNISSTSNLQQDLQGFDTLVNNFTAKQAEAGALTNRIQTTQQNLSQSATNLTQNLSTVQDANVATVITQLTNAQNVYKAALQVGAQYIQPSLADYISG